MKKLVMLTVLFCGFIQAKAISIDWTGGYRIEYTEVENPYLADKAGKKAYGLNYLYLQPKVIGSDGINIVSRFDIFGNEIPAYKNSQLGSFLGNGLTPATNATAGTGSNTTSQTADSYAIRASQLYLNVNQEYGSLVVGRAPFEFGMGMTFNAGLGEFDHWIDTRDILAYRFVVDNISFTPMLSKVYQKGFGLGTTISEQTFILEYNNKEAGAKAAVLHSTRKSSDGSNDANTAGYPNATNTIVGGYKSQTVNLYLERIWSSFQFKMEGSFLTGDTGVLSSSNEEIKQNSYAIAAEFLFPAQTGKWEYSGKLGMVSGDDPTTSTYEGYQLDQNYDVAILLFNHRMGQSNFLTTGILHANDTASGLSTDNSADDEAVGNATYLAPSVKYLWSEKLDIRSTLIYAQLNTNPNNFVDFKKDLGLELDTEFIYRPRERVTWSTGLGILFPGSAWKAGSLGYENKLNFGITTKAAITF